MTLLKFLIFLFRHFFQLLLLFVGWMNRYFHFHFVSFDYTYCRPRHHHHHPIWSFGPNLSIPAAQLPHYSRILLLSLISVLVAYLIDENQEKPHPCPWYFCVLYFPFDTLFLCILFHLVFCLSGGLSFYQFDEYDKCVSSKVLNSVSSNIHAYT